ncbi:MAG TPA: flagellar motor protein MotB [Terriglobales bacterium]|nr:flagellar motor protein MotB [Terriglobales bacterium]
MEASRPVIIVKKKVGHGGHHGGAWKVAYADFVTAMMALFIVLWLLNTSKPVREAIAGYFRDPAGTAGKLGTSTEGPGAQFVPTPVPTDDMAKLKDQIEKTMQQLPNFDKLKDQIEIKITSEGLRIELLESATGTFFDLGNSDPNKNGKELLTLLAVELGKLPNKVSIEGHTDSKRFHRKGIYSNWELSTDRANAARRIMQENGLGDKQVAQVRGFADELLRKPDDPYDPSNRRISLIVQYQTKEDLEKAQTPDSLKKFEAAAPPSEAAPAVESSKPSPDVPPLEKTAVAPEQKPQ